MDLQLLLAVLGVVLTILLPIGGWIIARRRRHIYSWKQVLVGVRELAENIRERGFEPEVILAFAKGGLIVADLLNQHFEHAHPICTIQTHRSTPGRKRTVAIDTTYATLEKLEGKRVLLVDDVAQSGSSLEKVMDLICSTYRVNRKRTFTVVLAVPKNILLHFRPDHYVWEYDLGQGQPVLPWGPVPKD